MTKAQASSRIPLIISTSIAGAILLKALGEIQARILRESEPAGISLLLLEKTKILEETPPVEAWVLTSWEAAEPSTQVEDRKKKEGF